MKLHAIIVLAGVFLSPSTLVSGNPQYGQPIIARGSNAYGAGVGFNDDSLVPLNQPIFDARQQQQGLPRARQAESRPSPVAGLAPQSGPRPLSDLAPSDQPSLGNRQPDGQRPAIGLDEVDLRITDFTTGGQEPPLGTNSLGSGPSVANSPPQPQVIGSAGQPLQGRGPGLNNILTSLPPPTSNDGGVIGVGAVGGNPEVVLGFERNSAQVGGEADGIPLSPGSGSSLQQQPLVARGGNTYGAGRGIEVPTSAPVPEVGGDLNIQPEQPQTREGILSQPALPDDDEVPTEPRAGNAFVAPGPRPIGNNEVSTDRAISQQPARPRTAAPVTPERPNDGEGHHMGGIEWLPESIPGQPLIDYPVLVRLPESGFDCANQDVDGFYADTSEEARCQAFWVCHNKQQDGFLCPNGTLFNQRYFTCDWWFNVRCEESPDYYELNRNIGVVGTRIDTLPAGVVAAASRVHPVSVLPDDDFQYGSPDVYEPAPDHADNAQLHSDVPE
ncbi:uncharacterized protein LOC119102515 isoform X2 [Pollicipes pollicipes]|uniref:uncharacterized protein LOC119102515 isoform X2 n=1 Tax=Pollicipes pollicipes TaxID=41117 RepID=UPI00188503B6|nr:uncharacterized protein LOC119102515 isoform X2 [Pollicipes pollicipes]